MIPRFELRFTPYSSVELWIHPGNEAPAYLYGTYNTMEDAMRAAALYFSRPVSLTIAVEP